MLSLIVQREFFSTNFSNSPLYPFKDTIIKMGFALYPVKVRTKYKKYTDQQKNTPLFFAVLCSYLYKDLLKICKCWKHSLNVCLVFVCHCFFPLNESVCNIFFSTRQSPEFHPSFRSSLEYWCIAMFK